MPRPSAARSPPRSPQALRRGRQPTVSPYGDGEVEPPHCRRSSPPSPISGALLKKGFYDIAACREPRHDDARTLIIAEAGVNHSGSLETALALVDAAADAGADIVKFQTFKANALAGRSANKADYQQRTTDASESQRAMLQRLELPHAAHHTLIARAKTARHRVPVDAVRPAIARIPAVA